MKELSLDLSEDRSGDVLDIEAKTRHDYRRNSRGQRQILSACIESEKWTEGEKKKRR